MSPPVAVGPDEPIAVVFAGARGSGHRAVVAALLGAAARRLPGLAGTYLVVRPGPDGDPYAFLPGLRQPTPVSQPADLEALTRPPRRIEVTRTDPLLRHFALVDAPDIEQLGVAGTRVLLEAAERGGALVFVTAAHRPPGRAELEFLAAVAGAGITILAALTPAPPARGARAARPDGTPAGPRLTDMLPSRRESLAQQVPALAGVTWCTVDPARTDTAYLRRALVEWAGAEGMRRASAEAPVWPSAGQPVRTGAEAAGSGWADQLERLTRAGGQLVRQRLAVELANIHLRCVQDIVFGTGCPGLPEHLDRELHALSLRATRECEAAVSRTLAQVLRRVLRDDLDEGIRRRVAGGVRRGFDRDPAAADLARVLLVTSTGGVTAIDGAGALSAMPAYPGGPADRVLPPIGIGLAGGCYLYWRHPANADVNKARSWLQRAVRGVELDLLGEVNRRLAAVRTSLAALVGEGIGHGRLLV